AELGAEYWYRNTRQMVCFADTVRALVGAGRCTFIEVSPHPLLSFALQEGIDVLGEPERGDCVVGTLRRGEPARARFTMSLAEAWVRGADVDWQKLFAGDGSQRLTLPTYPFQRERYWIGGMAAGAGDALAAGQETVEHPLLGAAVTLADERGLVLTGRLSQQTHGWLADHRAAGVVLLPGTAFLELALYAGSRVGCAWVRELLLQAPLVLPQDAAVQLQIILAGLDERGERSIELFARREPEAEAISPDPGGWVLHARGVLAGDAAAAGGKHAARGASAGEPAGEERRDVAPPLAGEWPPVGAEALDLELFYDQAAARGLEFGPLFQGLRAVWRRGAELFAEVSLAPELRGEAERFGVHPALLDAALHPLGASLLGDRDGPAGAGEEAWLPFSWSEVELHARGAGALRVRLGPAGEPAGSDEPSPDGTASLSVWDATGAPVATVGALAMRALSLRQLAGDHAGSHRTLFLPEWRPLRRADPAPARRRAAVLGEAGALTAALRGSGPQVESHGGLRELAAALDAGEELPTVVFAECLGEDGCLSSPDGEHHAGVAPYSGDGADCSTEGVAAAAHTALDQTLGLLQHWLADERFADARLVLVTRRAVAAAGEEDVPNMPLAPVWGLVRSAQLEHPGRFVLVDVDGEQASWDALPGALAQAEPQLALRAGELLAPRLVRAARADTPQAAASAATELAGTVLITGGTSGLGALIARHLVAQGACSLLLASRRGAQAQGALELQAELAGRGAEVRLAACDVSDRTQLQSLLASVPAQRPLCGVVHAAVALDDGVIGSLTPARLRMALAAKADAAWHLHELTAQQPLAMFVLFSSIAGLLGGAGQGSYAAGNAFLDALAAHRRARGMPACSIAWGLWDLVGGQAADERLRSADLARLARSGVLQLSEEEGLELFDLARQLDRPLMVAARLDLATLRANARTGALLPLLGELVPVGARGAAQEAAQARRLRAAPAGERMHAALEVVRGEVATVLGYGSARAIDPQRPFKELGADSLTAVELRNRLSAIAGVRLPATVVFDCPTSAALAERLLRELFPNVAAAPELEPEEATARRALATIPLERLRETGLLQALLELADSRAGVPADAEDRSREIDAMDVERLVAMTIDGGGAHGAGPRAGARDPQASGAHAPSAAAHDGESSNGAGVVRETEAGG
ncbi:MAG TPA: SDR family NAD(P)-dependent oxidoreductase, partial [Solirubrobacteraceae bacterium]|nr:SDR family NAD(P)-dependent oxidoreductase [Solirubrobacteraceae bacterium]